MSVGRATESTPELDRIRTWIGRLRYKPGWRFDAELENGAVVLTTSIRVPDARRDGETTVTARVQLGPESTTQVTAFQARVHSLITHLEMHEVGEWLTFDGKRPFDPHLGA